MPLSIYTGIVALSSSFLAIQDFRKAHYNYLPFTFFLFVRGFNKKKNSIFKELVFQ
jgi:hypothetical protein